MEIKIGRCRGEVIERFEDIQRVVILFYCYKCRKVHEYVEEEDWLNGLILARLS
jgi:hypothetical protein